MPTHRKKKLLIIGCAQHSHIEEYLKSVDHTNNETHILVPYRDLNGYNVPSATYFRGSFHPFLWPLVKVMCAFRPDEVVIVCGLTYDHDNVVHAVKFYSNFKDIKIKISVRNNESVTDSLPTPSLVKEIAKWAGLGAIALLVKAAKPFIKIRAGELYSSRLGHLALECEIYLSEADLGYHNKKYDLFYFKDGKVANKTLAQLYSLQMNISAKNQYVLDALRRFNLTPEHEVILNTQVMKPVRDSQCVIQQTENHIEFTSEQEERAQREMESMGLNQSQKHVCIFGRDSAYLEQSFPVFNDSDMQDCRDMEINCFKSGVEELLNLNYNVLRMGSIVKEPLQVNHPNFVDYATSGKRSDFMDIYLTAKCKFFVGIQSGVQQVANVFRVPCLRVNVVRLEIIEYCSPEDQALFKLHWSKKKKRFLKVKEIVESGIGLWPIERYANSDIELIDNTEDELMEAVKEMHHRVEGTWQVLPEDLELQKRYHSSFNVSKYNSQFKTPISSYFLRKYAKELL